MADAPRPDWRNTDAKASEATGSRPWKAKASEAAGPKMPSRRSLRRGIVLGCIVGLAVGIGILLSFIKGTRPACVVVVGSGYEHNLLLPHNVYGWHGGLELLNNISAEKANWFAELFGQKSGIRRTEPVALAESDWPATWQEIAFRINKGDAKEQVILYFSAHGYADEHDAYLLRDIANVKSPAEFNASRVRFSEILDSLKKDVPEEKGILLILDVCHVQSHWPIGMLKNDFVERLQKKYTDNINAMENLTVVCSTSPGQRSWVAEERQTSIFADYVSKGLQGEGRAVDESITAAGLFDYVEKRVNEWAKVNRAREQSPIRIGTGRDPELVRVARPVAKEQPPEKEDAPKAEPKKEEAPIAHPNDLKAVWKSWLVLKRDYAPQVYSPHYWRLYQETLLRFEQLKRAGDPTGKAGALKKKLDLLEVDIKTDKGLDKAFDCLGNSFPLARVLGFPPDSDLSDKELQAVLAKWKANSADRQKAGAALKLFAGKKELERRYWQTRLSRLFLSGQLNQAEFDHATISQDLLQLAEDLDVPQRTAEVHLVKMLQNVDAAQQPDLLKLAVSVRMLAEEAALGVASETELSELYAETIFKRMQKEIEAADLLRGEGEDLVFGDPKTRAAAARAKLTQAQAAYEKIRTDAKQLRKALSLRDDLAAELPFFDTSLALLPAVDNQNKKEIETLRTKAHSLGDSLARLTQYLDQAEEAPSLKTIEDELKYVREHYRMLGETLRALGADVQKNWHALDGVLSIPPAAATDKEIDLRIALLAKLRDTSRNLDAAKNREPQAEQQEDTVEVQRKLLRSSVKLYAEQIPKGEAKSVDDSVREFHLSQLKKTAEEAGELEKAAALQSAVGRSRVMLGSLADQLIDQRRDRINPAKRLRHLRTYHLLIGLAQRTLEDHWYDPGAKEEPTYYGPVAKAYLDGAAKILEPKDTKLLKERDELKRRLTPSGLMISSAPNRFWLLEAAFPLKYIVDAEAGVPAGLLTTWFEVPKGKMKVRETGAAPHTASTLLNDAEFSAQGKVPVAFHALYRGQKLTTPLVVERAAPNIIARYTPGPEKVGFAVRMDRGDYGAVSIVLDNSGSMRTLHPRVGENRDAKKGEDSRYTYAIKALEQVLKKLEPDTFLSVSTFGNDKNNKTEPQFVEPANNPSGKVYHRWQIGRLKSLIEDLSNRNLNNNSPIASAIIKSMEKGFPDKFEDPKLIIVLTDGMDNGSFAKIPGMDYDDQVADELRKAKIRHPDVDVIVVCFIEKGDPELESAKKQFLPIGVDNIIFEADGKKLGDIIEDRVSRPHVLLKQLNGDPVRGFGENGRPVNYMSDRVLTWHPSLERDDYKAGIRKRTGIEFDLKMRPGHNLYAMLNRQEEKFVLERGIVGLQPEVEKNNGKRKGDWLVTLLKHYKPLNSDSRSQLIAFEKTSQLGTLQQIPPGFVWLELETRDKKKFEQTLEWGSDLVVPAPALAVDVANWPAGDPKLAAWFWPRSWEDLLTTMKPMEKRINLKNPVVSPDDLIESVQWENRLVGVMTPKGRTEVNKYCLVIRTRYLDGKPVYVGLKEKDEFKRVGSEHQFFDRAGKSTACFYDLPPTLEEIDVVLIPVDRFKAAAAQEDTRVEFVPGESIAVPNIFRKDIIEAIHGSK